MANKKQPVDPVLNVDPEIFLLLDLPLRHESQTTVLRDLLDDALQKISEGNDALAVEIEKKIRMRQLKLHDLQLKLANAQRDNFELLTQVLKARVVRKAPAARPILPTDTPLPLNARQREVIKRTIQTLNITSRALNCLRGENIETVERLLEMREIDLMKVANLGKNSLDSIRNALALYDLKLGHLYDPNKKPPRTKWLGEE